MMETSGTKEGGNGGDFAIHILVLLTDAHVGAQPSGWVAGDI